MKPSLLFVCGKNERRSPTAEKIFNTDPRFSVRSAGVSPKAVHQISIKDIEWADLILCMEDKHKDRIKLQFSQIELPPIEVLEIPDEYVFMNQELIEVLRIKVEALLPQFFSVSFR